MFYVFFCKQKTAYEMRISDWSSDVCSSDLRTERGGSIDRGYGQPALHVADHPIGRLEQALGDAALGGELRHQHEHRDGGECVARRSAERLDLEQPQRRHRAQRKEQTEYAADAHGERHRHPRSEEHTSELQSLMRISSAVFCLKHKKKQVRYVK